MLKYFIEFSITYFHSLLLHILLYYW